MRNILVIYDDFPAYHDEIRNDNVLQCFRVSDRRILDSELDVGSEALDDVLSIQISLCACVLIHGEPFLRSWFADRWRERTGCIEGCNGTSTSFIPLAFGIGEYTILLDSMLLNEHELTSAGYPE